MLHTCVNTFASPTSAIFPVPSLVSRTLCDFRSNSLQQTRDNLGERNFPQVVSLAEISC